MDRNTGMVVIVAGAAIMVVGVAIWAGALSWFGRLPGDIRIEGDSTRVFIPITSMVIVSIVLTVAVNLFQRLR